jgi:hypothetical protein
MDAIKLFSRTIKIKPINQSSLKWNRGAAFSCKRLFHSVQHLSTKTNSGRIFNPNPHGWWINKAIF